MKIVELKDQGYVFPISIPNLASQDFSFKPWRMKEEKKIGLIKNKTKQIGVFVRQLFDEMLESLGGQEWASVEESKRKLLLNQMPYGNMFHMYVCLRKDALGSEFKMHKVSCPHCSATLEEVASDLDSLDIRVVEEGESPVAVYDLKKPFKIGEVMVDAVCMKHTPWDVMERFSQSDVTNSGAVKEAMIQKSYMGVKSKDIDGILSQLSPVQVLDNIAKVDIEGLSDCLEEHNVGPLLKMGITCNVCQGDFDAPLLWNYDHFFGSSSL